MSNPILTPEQEQRFWLKVDKSAGPNACWPWTGYCHPTGYGQNGARIKEKFAHRIAWQIVHGPIPDGLYVLHHCDNPPCCNPGPKHLFLGTQKDNLCDAKQKGRIPMGDNSFPRCHRERMARGDRNGSRTCPERRARGRDNGAYTRPERVPRGERNGMSKLSATEVREIREALRRGEYQKEIAARYGIVFATVSDIARGCTWGWLR